MPKGGGTSNGGVIGKVNNSSFGKNTVTSKTSSGNITTQPGTNSIATLPSPAGGCKVASFTVSGTLTIS